MEMTGIVYKNTKLPLVQLEQIKKSSLNIIYDFGVKCGLLVILLVSVLKIRFKVTADDYAMFLQP